MFILINNLHCTYKHKWSRVNHSLVLTTDSLCLSSFLFHRCRDTSNLGFGSFFLFLFFSSKSIWKWNFQIQAPCRTYRSSSGLTFNQITYNSPNNPTLGNNIEYNSNNLSNVFADEWIKALSRRKITFFLKHIFWVIFKRSSKKKKFSPLSLIQYHLPQLTFSNEFFYSIKTFQTIEAWGLRRWRAHAFGQKLSNASRTLSTSFPDSNIHGRKVLEKMLEPTVFVLWYKYFLFQYKKHTVV